MDLFPSIVGGGGNNRKKKFSACVELPKGKCRFPCRKIKSKSKKDNNNCRTIFSKKKKYYTKNGVTYIAVSAKKRRRTKNRKYKHRSTARTTLPTERELQPYDTPEPVNDESSVPGPDADAVVGEVPEPVVPDPVAESVLPGPDADAVVPASEAVPEAEAVPASEGESVVPAEEPAPDPASLLEQGALKEPGQTPGEENPGVVGSITNKVADAASSAAEAVEKVPTESCCLRRVRVGCTGTRGNRAAQQRRRYRNGCYHS